MAPEIMDSMVSHMSVSDCGGKRPYPMHSMCDMALNSAQEYCSSQNASWKVIAIFPLYMCSYIKSN